MRKVRKLIFVVVSILSFFICFTYAENKENIDIDKITGNNTFQLNFDKKLDDQNFFTYASRLSRNLGLNIYQRVYQQNGGTVFYGVFDSKTVSYYQEKLFQSDRNHWILNQNIRIKKLSVYHERIGKYLIQLRNPNSKRQLSALRKSLKKYFHDSSFTLHKNSNYKYDLAPLNYLNLLLTVSLFTIVLLMWFDYLFSLRSRNLKALFGYGKIDIFFDLLTNLKQPLIYGLVSIFLLTVALSIKLGKIIFPVLYVAVIAICLLLLTTTFAALIFLSILSFSSFKVINIKGFSYARFLYRISLFGKIIVAFFLLILLQKFMAPTLDLAGQFLKNNFLENSYSNYQTIMIKPLIAKSTSAKKDMWIVRQETKLFKKLFKDNGLIISKPDNNAFIKAYHDPSSNHFDYFENENMAEVSPEYLHSFPIYRHNGKRILVKDSEKDMIVLVPVTEKKNIKTIKKNIKSDNYAQNWEESDEDYFSLYHKHLPKLKQKIRFIYIKNTTLVNPYLRYAFIRYPVIRVITSSNLNKDYSNYVYNSLVDYRGIYFKSHGGDVKKAIHDLGLQKYFSDPVNSKDLIAENNHGEIEYYTLCISVVACLFVLYIYFAGLFLYSYISYRKRELILKYIFGFNLNLDTIEYSLINSLPWLILVPINIYFRTWLAPYYLGAAFLEFFLTFLAFKMIFKRELRGYRC